MYSLRTFFGGQKHLRKILRRQIVFLIVLSFIFATQAGTALEVSADEDESLPVQPSLTNGGYEQGIAPWVKRPAGAPGNIWAECNQQHNAVGNCNGVLEPSGADVIMQQTVSVNPGKWNVQVRVSTNGGVTGQLQYKMDGVVTVCDQTAIVWPNYTILDCDIEVPQGILKVHLRIRALAAPAGKRVYVDDWSFTKNPYNWRQASRRQTWTGQTYTGVNAMIDVPHPQLREFIHSYSTIHVKTYNVGIEAGLFKAPTTGCTTKVEYSYSSDNWTPHEAPINVNPFSNLEFSVVRTAVATWRVKVWDENGNLLWQSNNINIPGFDQGEQIVAGGEVFSPRKQNDMGVSWITNLRYKTPGVGGWVPWNGYLEINTNGAGPAQPPYDLQGVMPDPNSNIAVWGNNGNPIIPGSPCP